MRTFFTTRLARKVAIFFDDSKIGGPESWGLKMKDTNVSQNPKMDDL